MNYRKLLYIPLFLIAIPILLIFLLICCYYFGVYAAILFIAAIGVPIFAEKKKRAMLISLILGICGILIGSVVFYQSRYAPPKEFPVQGDWKCLRKMHADHFGDPSHYQRYEVSLDYIKAADLVESHFKKFFPHPLRADQEEIRTSPEKERLQWLLWGNSRRWPYVTDGDFSLTADFIVVYCFGSNENGTMDRYLVARISKIADNKSIVELWNIHRLNM